MMTANNSNHPRIVQNFVKNARSVIDFICRADDNINYRGVCSTDPSVCQPSRNAVHSSHMCGIQVCPIYECKTSKSAKTHKVDVYFRMA